MALPPLTPEQRQAALDKAAASRRERAEVKNRLKNAGASISEVIAEGQKNEVIGKMRVVDLLQSMPGLGKVRAKQTKPKSAFTLRLDADRHLRLRLASAVTDRSAQQLVTEALDAFLATLPEVEGLAQALPAKRRKIRGE